MREAQAPVRGRREITDMARRMIEAARRSAREEGCALRHAPCMPGPERLVGLGFRYWMLGRNTGEIGCWERAWSLYSGVFGSVGAKAAVGALADWVKTVSVSSRRAIEVFPEGCGGFCRDECVAISMIAACQHNTCPALRACAFALVESGQIDDVVARAQAFADTMASLDHVLSPGSIITTAATMPAANRLPS